jgi:hypothetical protein|eukprot:COSAG06_NODE_1021_length_11055_cov_7.993976_8_plen_35_part_00
MDRSINYRLAKVSLRWSVDNDVMDEVVVWNAAAS